MCFYGFYKGSQNTGKYTKHYGNKKGKLFSNTQYIIFFYFPVSPRKTSSLGIKVNRISMRISRRRHIKYKTTYSSTKWSLFFVSDSSVFYFSLKSKTSALVHVSGDVSGKMEKFNFLDALHYTNDYSTCFGNKSAIWILNSICNTTICEKHMYRDTKQEKQKHIAQF